MPIKYKTGLDASIHKKGMIGQRILFLLPNWKGCDEKFSIEKNLSRGNN
jgi:hypothetical protein